jgi:hypothetical protein
MTCGSLGSKHLGCERWIEPAVHSAVSAPFALAGASARETRTRLRATTFNAWMISRAQLHGCMCAGKLEDRSESDWLTSTDRCESRRRQRFRFRFCSRNISFRLYPIHVSVYISFLFPRKYEKGLDKNKIRYQTKQKILPLVFIPGET